MLQYIIGGVAVKIRKQLVVLLLCGVIMLSGCAARTVDEMYQLPKRSEAYNDLQTAIDSAISCICNSYECGTALLIVIFLLVSIIHESPWRKLEKFTKRNDRNGDNKYGEPIWYNHHFSRR